MSDELGKTLDSFPESKQGSVVLRQPDNNRVSREHQCMHIQWFSAKTMLAILLLAMNAMFAGFSQTPQELIDSSTLFGDYDSLRLDLTMTIVNADGNSRERRVNVFLSDGVDGRRMLMEITSPSFLRNLKFLSLESDGSTVQWMNTSTGVRRIPESSRAEAIFDSDFLSSDFASFDSSAYRIEEIHGQTLLGFETRTFRLIPLSESSGPSKTVSIEPASGILLAVEFDASPNHDPRSLVVTEVDQQNDALFPRAITIRNTRTGTLTELRVVSIITNERIPDSVFSRSRW